MILLKKDSSEWNWMWDKLADHPLNEGIPEPMVALNSTSNEAWQYMGSFRNNKDVIHEFRHRSHPKDNERHYYKFNCSDTFDDADIETCTPIK